MAPSNSQMATGPYSDTTKPRPKSEDEFLMQLTIVLHPVSIYVYAKGLPSKSRPSNETIPWEDATP